MRTFSASEIRLIHEERIAPYIKGNNGNRPEETNKNNKKAQRRGFLGLFQLVFSS